MIAKNLIEISFCNYSFNIPDYSQYFISYMNGEIIN